MARSRNIKPSFFTNEELVELPYATRLLFIGLWTIADRAGRLEDRPKRIKIELFPCDDLDIDAALTELAEHLFLTRYQVNGQRYIQITNFEKHQSPHVKEAESTIPAPCMSGASTGLAALNPDSPILIPDSLNPEHTVASATVRESYPPDFEAFWREYPTGHGSKKRAYAEWRKLKPDDELCAEIMRGLAAWNASDRWQRGFVKLAELWLRDQLWPNPPPPEPQRTNGATRIDPIEQTIRNLHTAYGKAPPETAQPEPTDIIETTGAVT